MTSRVIAFDINETLLDLAGLDAPFEAAFGDADARGPWFTQLLSLAMTSVIIDSYHDFSTLGGAALHMVASKRGTTLNNQQVSPILERMRHLSPHSDVVPALETLQNAGFRMAALTNSAPSVAHAQLENASLAGYFEVIISVDEVQCFKPAPQPYRRAATRLGVATADLRMIAVHDWDIAGAMAAGCAGAFVERGDRFFNPLAPAPDVTGADLKAVADTILTVDQ